MSEHIRVMTSRTIIVNRVASILEENGISTLIKDISESGRLAGFGTATNEVDLFVDETDLEKAQSIIRDYESEVSR